MITKLFQLCMPLVLVCIVVAVVIVIAEYMWRSSRHPSEVTRKFTHIVVGSFVAIWPFFLSWHQIRILSVAFLLVVAISKYLHLFQSIHNVGRTTWGEVWFAVAVGALTFIAQDKAIYTVALLEMSLADGLAAIIGTNYGKGNRYTFLGHTKSIAGTSTFFVVSLVLLTVYSIFSNPLSPQLIIALSALAMLIENTGVFGLDNVFVPVVIGVILCWFL